MVVFDFVWATDPGNPSMVRNGKEAVKMGENICGVALFNGLWLKSLIDNVAKWTLFIKFHECSCHKIKRMLSNYCHMGLKMQSTFVS